MLNYSDSFRLKKEGCLMSNLTRWNPVNEFED